MCSYSKVLFVVLVAFMFGCAVQSGALSGVNKQGLPDRQYLVGTAVDQVDYRAPVDGAAYIVDPIKQRVIAIKSLRAGEQWRYELPKIPDKEVDSTYGPDQQTYNIRVSLYFIPRAYMKYEQDAPVEKK